MHPSKPTITACALVTVVLCSSVWIGVYSDAIRDNNRHDIGESEAVDTTIDASAPPTTTTNAQTTTKPLSLCQSSCQFEYVESIPYNMTYAANSSTHTSTIDCWNRLISLANRTIDIGSYYWSLRAADVENADYSAQPGSDILDRLIAVGIRGVAIRVAQNDEIGGYANTIELTNRTNASVRSLNFSHWFDGGILHTKFWNVDNQHFYVGSANLDWRSLTQVKELGVGIYNCPCLGDDLRKIFEVYWTMGIPNQTLPTSWPDNLATDFNATNPMSVQLRDVDNGDTNNSLVYLSSSPPGFRPKGRQDDAQAIIDVIAKAQQFVHIAVMDYIPATLYQTNNRYWPDIDDALRHAAYDRFVHVRLLMSKWIHTSSNYFGYLNSLSALNRHLPCKSTIDAAGHYNCIANSSGSIEIKIFEVPIVGNQSKIPYSRVNHNKYMVTDNTAYIGTSNWAGDYFITTAGVGIVIRSENNAEQLKYVRTLNDDVFMRDWNSNYAKWLDQYDQYGKPLTNNNTTPVPNNNTTPVPNNNTSTCDNNSANRQWSTNNIISLMCIIFCYMSMTTI